MDTLIKFLYDIGFKNKNGVFVKDGQDPTFETEYLSIRETEGRVYTIGEIRLLPFIPKNHPYASEWKVRKRSALIFAGYIKQKGQPLKVLEIGCGNGWLSGFLAHKFPESQFVGIDVTLFELKQAAEAFSTGNTVWLYGNIEDGILPEGYFDLIVFAASIQYFPKMKECLKHVSKFLNPVGELHIMDSPFYAAEEIPNASKRTSDYYSRMGNPAMASHYFHHVEKDLYQPGFNTTKLNNTILLPWFKNIQTKLGFDYFGWYRLTKR